MELRRLFLLSLIVGMAEAREKSEKGNGKSKRERKREQRKLEKANRSEKRLRKEIKSQVNFIRRILRGHFLAFLWGFEM